MLLNVCTKVKYCHFWIVGINITKPNTDMINEIFELFDDKLCLKGHSVSSMSILFHCSQITKAVIKSHA